MAEEEGRRYDWVEYENGIMLGNKVEPKDWFSVNFLFLFWFLPTRARARTRSRWTPGGGGSSGTAATASASVTRSPTTATGSDKRSRQRQLTLTLRFWSLLPATADTANNKVVTGVRFTKIGKVIYPQIEQATALEEVFILKIQFLEVIIISTIRKGVPVHMFPKSRNCLN